MMQMTEQTKWLHHMAAAGLAVVLTLTISACSDLSQGSETTEFIDEGATPEADVTPVPQQAVVNTPDSPRGTPVSPDAGEGTPVAGEEPVSEADTQAIGATGDGSSVQVNLANVTFQIDPALANSVNAVQVAGTPNQPDTPPGDETPGHLYFTFLGYYPNDNSDLQLDRAPYQPQILVYDTSAFGDYSATEDGEVGFGSELAKLQGLLESQVELATQETLPFLPLSNAVQGLHSNETYLEFNGGRGIRYLAQFGQDISPVLEGQLFYTFQGLSSDGRYYVAAIFPVDTGILPLDLPAELTPDQIISTWDQYRADLRAQLGSLAPDDFTPSLEMLDAVVQSLTISE